MGYTITIPEEKDIPEIFRLYKTVASQKGNLAREEDEIDEKYVEDFVRSAFKRGIIKTVIDTSTGEIAAELHAYINGYRAFRHVLTNLTIVVHPAHQGKGLGRMIFRALLDDVKNNRHDILRVELITRDTNEKAMKLYESLGFAVEGIFIKRVINHEGKFVNDIQMVWFNPNYNGSNSE
jgi:ribosomal protein S18 acetylase RimI-like enzyme